MQSQTANPVGQGFEGDIHYGDAVVSLGCEIGIATGYADNSGFGVRLDILPMGDFAICRSLNQPPDHAAVCPYSDGVSTYYGAPVDIPGLGDGAFFVPGVNSGPDGSLRAKGELWVLADGHTLVISSGLPDRDAQFRPLQAHQEADIAIARDVIQRLAVTG